MSKPTYVAIYTCARCLEEIAPLTEDDIFAKFLLTELRGAQYGRNANGDKHCYPCCGAVDREYMISTGKITLYLSNEADDLIGGLTVRNSMQGWNVSNWPDSLRFKIKGYPRKGDHNIARYRYDVWFNGPDGHLWWGVQYGDNTQLCHCKRTKERIG